MACDMQLENRGWPAASRDEGNQRALRVESFHLIDSMPLVADARLTKVARAGTQLRRAR